MRRYYTQQPLAVGQSLSLEPRLVHYLAKVLRARPDDALVLFNGDGMEYSTRIEQVNKASLRVYILSAKPGLSPAPLALHLGQVMGKGDRMDWIVQKATELGVAVITPLTSEHAEVRLAPERALKKQVHWQEVALNACEQCGRGDLPDIRTPQPLQDWLDQASGQKLVLHTEGQRQRLSDVSTDQPCHLLVGPEGGFSVREVRAALSAGFTAISLGPRVLRMETAAIAATAVLQWLASDST